MNEANINNNKKNIDGLINHSAEQNKIVIECMEQAIIELMKVKPYSSITITELCKKAGVSRVAFYNNFKTKEELIKNIVRDIDQKLIDKIGSPLRNSGLKSSWYLEVFLYLDKVKDTYLLLIREGFEEWFLRILNEFVMVNDELTLKQKYKRYVWNGAIVNIMVSWIKGELEMDVKELSRYCYLDLARLYEE